MSGPSSFQRVGACVGTRLAQCLRSSRRSDGGAGSGAKAGNKVGAMSFKAWMVGVSISVVAGVIVEDWIVLWPASSMAELVKALWAWFLNPVPVPVWAILLAVCLAAWLAAFLLRRRRSAPVIGRPDAIEPTPLAPVAPVLAEDLSDTEKRIVSALRRRWSLGLTREYRRHTRSAPA